MDSFFGGNKQNEQTVAAAGQERPPQQQTEAGGFMGKINSALGGGAQSEAKEDYLDKGVDWVQEHVMGQGPQTNESAFEQAKDEQISDAIRRGWKGQTGGDFPIKDKE
ncbi:hypothetical protein EXIGLDRAFT_627244 [Exidia glandulosa HHB12029]|uniref:DNA damage-responsive protein 48 n=1 Tax=Exidia glandulosa HHB12029 TaxID=1314781 RepID=A0A165CDL4_EXIGL|nr:hypothetical protein EXIGLDRAFT_627244 [Exidia glandulosa HHB12029]